MVFKLRNLDFGVYLMIISVLGFTAILVSSLTGIDIGPWVDSLLFLIIGTALMISGGIRFFFKYFQEGLTPAELNRIVSIVVGIASAIVGIMTAPFFGIQAEVLNGIKAIIAVIAILTILAERYRK